MRYAEYDRKICNDEDVLRYKNLFEKDIADKQNELQEFIKRGNERVKWIKESEENKEFSILGGLRKNGRNKEILLIIRYKDGTQRDERYLYGKIGDAKNKISELKEKYSGVDWSKFEEEIS